MTEYSWDGQILRKTKSESKSKLEQNWFYSRIVIAVELFFSANSMGFI
jgi:hypothetical protein